MVPELDVVIDHIAKPDIKAHSNFDDWLAGMTQLAEDKSTYCKISGMVTEADWKKWGDEDFKVYLDALVKLFGIKRLMFGSDWPVCQVAADYKDVKRIIEDYFSGYSQTDRDDIFGNNACRFYQID